MSLYRPINKCTYILLLFVVVFGCKGDGERPLNELMMGKKTWKFISAQNDSKPIPRHEAAFVKVGSSFYLLGGRGIKPVSIYNTQTGTWSMGANPPLELHHFQPIVYGQRIYIVGAMTGGWPSETPVAHVYIYDPISDIWSKSHEIPEDRRRGSTGNVLHNGEIYVSCGIRNGHIGGYKNWLDRYDPESGTWETLPDAPRARDHFQAVLAEGQIYAIAGRNSTSPDNPFGNTIKEVDVYEIKTRSWRTLPNHLPTPRAGNASILYDGEVLVIGGESDSQEEAHRDVEAIDITAKTWRTLRPMKQGRHGTGVVIYDNVLFVASGCGKRGGEPELTTMECFSD